MPSNRDPDPRLLRTPSHPRRHFLPLPKVHPGFSLPLWLFQSAAPSFWSEEAPCPDWQILPGWPNSPVSARALSGNTPCIRSDSRDKRSAKALPYTHPEAPHRFPSPYDAEWNILPARLPPRSGYRDNNTLSPSHPAHSAPHTSPRRSPAQLLSWSHIIRSPCQAEDSWRFPPLSPDSEAGHGCPSSSDTY